jgi:membrane associated rhomboid family serine protease
MLPIRDLNPRRRIPLVTWALIAANIVVFFAVEPSSFATLNANPNDTRQENVYLYQHALVPCEVSHWHALTPSLVAQCEGRRTGLTSTEPYFPGKSVAESVLASMFFHGSLIHLFGNMLFLWIFGDNVEDRFGHVGYLLLYVLGGVAASVAYVLSDPSSLTPTLGASGSIAVVMGAYLVLFPRARILTVILPLVFLPFLVPAALLLAFWFVLQFFTGSTEGVAWVAHVAGFAIGALVALAVFRRGRPAPVARS